MCYRELCGGLGCVLSGDEVSPGNLTRVLCLHAGEGEGLIGVSWEGDTSETLVVVSYCFKVGVSRCHMTCLVLLDSEWAFQDWHVPLPH